MTSKEKTDRQTDKSSRWSFTAYEEQYALFNTMPPGIAEWGWNAEICPETNRPHRQGYLRLQSQQRFAWLKKILPGVHIEVAKNWDALVNYCKKEDTRAPGTIPVHQTNSIPTHFQYAETVAQQYVELYGLSDLDDCEWDPPLVTRTKLISIMDRLDAIVNKDITEGRRYAAWITTNPAWTVMWKSKAKPFLRSFAQKDL
ncbi:MAG: replication associated protein [Cressdnaviricota sp.]|nr:MAG: replication associated protein [Cressdnaviricota sp.]